MSGRGCSSAARPERGRGPGGLWDIIRRSVMMKSGPSIGTWTARSCGCPASALCSAATQPNLVSLGAGSVEEVALHHLDRRAVEGVADLPQALLDVISC